MELQQIAPGEREKFLHLLLIADESEELVRTYIDLGDLYVVLSEVGEQVGVVQVVGDEIKNLAIATEQQSKGFGKRTIKLLQERFPKLTVGTANSSIDNLAFYQKCGFRFTGVRRDFFLQYPEPIYENGIRAYDMLMLEWVEPLGLDTSNHCPR